MAQSPAVRRARRSLTALLVIVIALVGIIALGVWRGEATWTPKLALDLQGGTQILLAPTQIDGQSVSGEQLDQAVAIIRQRVDASGVAEAEIATQGSQNISVSIPGKADEATLQRIEASAKLDFRPVLYLGQGTSAPTAEDQAAADTEISGDGTSVTDESGAVTGEVAPGDAAAQEPATDADAANVDPDPLPDTAYDTAWLTEGLLAEFNDFSCTSEQALGLSEAATDRPLITCDQYGVYKYILGPVEMSGETISDASAMIGTTSTGATTGQWVVQMTLNDQGTKTFGEISTRMYGATPPLNQFAFVLDGLVVSAPEMNGQILDGRPSISGSFTQESAEALADQLKFGALPIGFTVLRFSACTRRMSSVSGRVR